MSTRTPPPARWAFLLPIAVVLGASRLGDDKHTGAELVAIAVTSAAAGVAWQLLHRRDLTDRFTYFAALFVATIATIGVLWGEQVTAFPQSVAVCAGGILTGCVYGEQWLRGRDVRARRASAATLSIGSE